MTKYTTLRVLAAAVLAFHCAHGQERPATIEERVVALEDALADLSMRAAGRGDVALGASTTADTELFGRLDALERAVDRLSADLQRIQRQVDGAEREAIAARREALAATQLARDAARLR